MATPITATGNARLLLPFACSAALLAAGCASLDPPPKAPDAGKVRQELLEADRAFARLAQEQGAAEAFYSFAAEDAALFPNGELPVKGRDAIRVTMSSGAEGSLYWEPREAQASGDMGYTWGLYQFVSSGDGTQSRTNFGKYVTIWKRQAEGGWKYILDIGNAAPPPRLP
jgi:ketosteroid isomerase-like protein